MVGVALALALTGSSSAAGAAEDAGADAGSLPGCVGVSTDSRYVPYGYNHVVVIKNGCSKPATCSVSTDVNPKPVTSEVGALKSVEVVTFSGSPSQTFTARVSCILH